MTHCGATLQSNCFLTSVVNTSCDIASNISVQMRFWLLPSTSFFPFIPLFCRLGRPFILQDVRSKRQANKDQLQTPKKEAGCTAEGSTQSVRAQRPLQNTGTYNSHIHACLHACASRTHLEHALIHGRALALFAAPLAVLAPLALLAAGPCTRIDALNLSHLGVHGHILLQATNSMCMKEPRFESNGAQCDHRAVVESGDETAPTELGTLTAGSEWSCAWGWVPSSCRAE